MEKLIECVRVHPCLWNPQHPDYSDVHARGNAWQTVTKALNDKSIPNSMKPKSSSIWNYFVVKNENAAICTICEKEYSRKGRTTTALKSHLKSMHPEQFAEFERLDAYRLLRKQEEDQEQVKAARTEWRKLRDNHREALKRAKLGQNKLLPAQVTTWKYAKQMQFLEPHMKYRITENIEMEPTTPPGSKSSEQDVSTTDVVDDGRSASTDSSMKRHCTDCTEAPPTKLLRPEEDLDALESFFSCILKTTRDMPHWMQTQVKKKIFAVIIEAEENLSTHEQIATNVEYGSDYRIEHRIKTERRDET